MVIRTAVTMSDGYRTRIEVNMYDNVYCRYTESNRHHFDTRYTLIEFDTIPCRSRKNQIDVISILDTVGLNGYT